MKVARELVGASRESRAQARVLLDNILKTPIDVVAFSNDIFAIVQVLDSSAALRRGLTDPARDKEDKSALVQTLLKNKFSGAAIELLQELTKMRWSSPADFSNVLEQLAIETETSAANMVEELDRLEEEIFVLSRIIASNSELRQSLSSPIFSPAAKQSLITSLIRGKVSASTSRLLNHIASGLRGRNIESTMSYYQAAIAARRERLVAFVRIAVPISVTQRKKLESVLAEKIGQPVRVNLEIDKAVLGGVSIRFGDELIDATIASRIADVGRALAG
ncbi:MAG: F0F1 ATP synthase subunit delta [Actinobacteria bacterium]|nr:F0F1 ATP synthase subunit delta [Actinomycetota bacterium]